VGTFLVTGAAGFIGSHVAQKLVARGDTVVGIDNLNDYYSTSHKRANLDEVGRSDPGSRFRFVKGDIRDSALISSIFSEHAFDSVLHMAAMAGVRASIESPDLYYDVNVDGTLVLLRALVDVSPTSRFVLASTSSVYGATKQLPFVETDPCDRPLVPYSASKRAAEMLGYVFHNLYGIHFTALRFFTVYGPRGRPDMMAFKVAASISAGSEVPLYNGGNMYRDWTYVEDIVQGVMGAGDRELGYEIINLGRGEPVLLSEFVSIIEELSGSKASFVQEAMPPGDVPATHADISKARRLLGYNPTTSVREGVTNFIEWYERRGAAAQG
jgi:UDP-glucuronate 4-epimerase